jgi:hypothetical protein
VVAKFEEAAGAAKNFPGKVLKGAEDLAGGAKSSGGANLAVADLSSGIKIPKLSLDNLTKEQIDAANAFLAAHVTAQDSPFETPKDSSGFLILLKGRSVTVDEVVQALKAEIPSRVLQDPTAELKELVKKHITQSALKASQQKTSGKVSVEGIFQPPRLIAKAGKGRVKLLWTAVKDVTTYNVYRSEISGNIAGKPLQSVRANTFTDTGVTNGITYFYHVTAQLGPGRESASSPEASAKPQAAISPEAEIEFDRVVKTKVSWDVEFIADDGLSPVQILRGHKIETQVDQAGNADSVEAQLNIIRLRIEKDLTKSGSVKFTANAAAAVKGEFGHDTFKSAEVEVKAEVELKLHQITLKLAAKVGPDGQVHPEAGLVIWRFH